MSVMACNRKGCDNVLCDRWSNTFGYICPYCFDELIAAGIGIDIEVFMASSIRLTPEVIPDPYLHYDAVFRGSWVGST